VHQRRQVLLTEQHQLRDVPDFGGGSDLQSHVYERRHVSVFLPPALLPQHERDCHRAVAARGAAAAGPGLAMFARHPRLERYAWYPWTTNNELAKMGALTALGTAFAALPQYK
jgi:hypothetical protein